MFGRLRVDRVGELPLLAREQIARRLRVVGLEEHLVGQQLERTAVDAARARQEALQGRERLAAVRRSGVVDYGAFELARARIPVGRLGQV